jgi:membrane protease YdiL (CAAX protease family)
MESLFVGGPVLSQHLGRGASEHAVQAQFRFWIPILISSALFAAMHIGQGPAPIPLFLLAIGLGYIFRKTGSWVPCVIIHFLLNFVSLTVFSLQIIYPELMPVEPVRAFAF